MYLQPKRLRMFRFRAAASQYYPIQTWSGCDKRQFPYSVFLGPIS